MVSEPTMVRVTGRSSLETRADTACFEVTVHRRAATAAQARRAAATAVAAAETRLARFSGIVIEQTHDVVAPTRSHEDVATPDETDKPWCGCATIRVVAKIGPSLPDLLVKLAGVKGAEVGAPTYRVCDPERFVGFARKQAVTDAASAARATAEALGATVSRLDWTMDAGAPEVTSGRDLHVTVTAQVTAQFEITAPALTSPPITSR